MHLVNTLKTALTDTYLKCYTPLKRTPINNALFPLDFITY